jgi:hypothetical protein
MMAQSTNYNSIAADFHDPEQSFDNKSCGQDIYFGCVGSKTYFI